MKVRTAQILVAAFSMAFMVLQVTDAAAQRNNGTFVGEPQASSQRRPPAPPLTSPIGGSVILPMGNPVAPMGNPVAPVVSTPFVRYSDPTPTVVIPDPSRDNRVGQRNRGRDVVYVPVPVPTSYYPPYYNSNYYYPDLEPTPVTVPGQLPGVRYDNPQPAQQGMFTSSTNVPAPSSTFVGAPQSEAYSEPRMIVHEPRPNRVIQPPTIGTPRADVIALLGQPWGTVSSRGQETLYFEGLTVVFAADGRVIQVR